MQQLIENPLLNNITPLTVAMLRYLCSQPYELEVQSRIALSILGE